MQNSKNNPAFRPRVLGLIVLVIVAIYGGDLLLRQTGLLDSDPPRESNQPVEPPQADPSSTTREPTAVPASGVSVEVIDVPDGDSLVVTLAGKRARVRLQGVDCPERAQAFGREAQQFSKQLMQGKSVTLVKHGTDQYERILASVTLPDGRDLGETLVQAGLAWQYRRYNQDAAVQRFEQQARTARRGLWSADNPTPPWQWRREHPRQ